MARKSLRWIGAETPSQEIQDMVDPTAQVGRDSRGRSALYLATLGVVFGDIGTSPLYALRECFRGPHAVAPTPDNVLGVLSLITWALLIVISLKYVSYILRADNAGEGGILALLALIDPWKNANGEGKPVLLAIGIFGAALLYGDGMITPAISVLSAIEGLGVAAPHLQAFVVPLTLVILTALFLLQRHGTARIGSLFGPAMGVWFTTIAFLGLLGVADHPEILGALNPLHGARFLLHSGPVAFFVLGAVFLVVTGGEALYADMGHFGASPIRRTWFAVVLPALLLNYFGQGALLLAQPEASQPFYQLSPEWARLPLVGLATVATVIASQAVITGAFSLTRQAVHLQQWPRLAIRQTSSTVSGQIYIPFVNWVLFAGTAALVLGFEESSALAGAYGVAVSATMVITTLLAFHVARERWTWGLPLALSLTMLLVLVDLAFLGANLAKVNDGGWFPLVVGGLVFTGMMTWRRGRVLLAQRLRGIEEPIHMFAKRLDDAPPLRVPGTAVFMTGNRGTTPPMLLHHVEHNQVLHEQVVVICVVTDERPFVPGVERATVVKLRDDLFHVTVHYGFMEVPDVPEALASCEANGVVLAPSKTTYYVGRETLLASARPGMALWRERLFAFMARNAARPAAYYRLPPQHVIELGIQVEI